ncbi:MAG: GNAT family N-acetyltransferase [Chloroflexota bacterium]
MENTGFLIPLRDGKTAHVRQVRPSDKSVMNAAFKLLSDESKYARFLTVMHQLNENQLTYFTDIDQVNHVAWGVDLPYMPEIPGIAVGRYVRIKEEPAAAEFALTVIDQFQGQGLGRFLLALLYRLAQQQGDIKTLRGVIGTSNDKMISWMRQLGADLYLSPEYVMHADLPVHQGLPDMPDNRAARRFVRVLDLIQQGEANQRCPLI